MTLYPAALAQAALEGCEKIVVMTSSRCSPSPLDSWKARIMEILAQIAAEPPWVCRLTACMPEISAIACSVRQKISSTPCSEASSCNGCSSASLGVRMIVSLTLGLYFMVQVPWPMSTLKSAPRFSWLMRR